jgi:hypothetical protein
MTINKRRLDRVEDEIRFRVWVSVHRMLETMTIEELDVFVATGRWPDRPDPAPGTSHLDAMDRAGLVKLWKEDIRKYADAFSNFPGRELYHQK